MAPPWVLISFPVGQATGTEAFLAVGLMWARVQRSKPRRVGKGYRLASGWGFEYEAEELKLGLTDRGSH